MNILAEFLTGDYSCNNPIKRKEEKMNNLVEFRSGDCSCVYWSKRRYYEVCVTKCGEMRQKKFDDFEKVENFLVDNYNFTVDMIAELKNKIVIWDK